MGRFNTLEFQGSVPPSGVVSAAPSVPGERIKDAQYYLDEANRHFFRTEYEEALQDYSKAVGIDPGSAAAWQGQVFCLTALQEFHEAKLWLSKAQGIVGESAELLALQALIAARTGDFDRACGYSDASLEAGGGSPLPFVVRGELFIYSKRNAEQCFDQACALALAEPWKVRALVADGCLYAEGKSAAMLGVKFLQPALEMHPDRPELYLRMAALRVALGENKWAQSALEQCAALDPEFSIPPELKRAAGRGWLRRLFGF